MLLRIIASVIILMTFLPTNRGQTLSSGQLIESYMEKLVSFGFDEGHITDISEEVGQLSVQPVDINSANEDELSRLFFLTPFQVKSLLRYRYQKGNILSVNEISFIPGFDNELTALMEPFILITDGKQGKYGNTYSKNILLSNIIFYDKEDIFPGNNIKSLTKFNHSAGRISTGFTIEKDAGEKVLDKNHYPDFFSGYVSIEGSGKLKKLILGDFAVRFGQGIILWHGYSAGTFPLDGNPMKGISTIKPYTSSDENNFFRGIAAISRLSGFKILTYISDNKIDGNIKYYPGKSGKYISSFYDNGLHNSLSTFQKHDVINEFSAGINISRNIKFYSLGVSLTTTQFSLPVEHKETTREVFDFSGNHNFSASIDNSLSFSKLYLYGEYAISSDKGIAIIQGARIMPADRIRINILYGNTGRGYSSFHGKLFGKETVNNFRRGVLTNITADLAPHLTLMAGILRQNENWYGYYSGTFRRSVKYISEISYEPFENFNITASLRNRVSSDDINPERGIKVSEENNLNSGRLTLRCRPVEWISLSARIEINSENSGEAKGVLTYAGIKVIPEGFPLNITLRTAVYSIDSYSNRIYTWEDDLLFTPMISPLYGDGVKSYIVINYNYNRKINLRFKTSYSDYLSGEVRSVKHDYRIQVKINF